MPHSKFRGNLPAGSGEEDPDAANKISFLLPKEAHIKFGF